LEANLKWPLLDAVIKTAQSINRNQGHCATLADQHCSRKKNKSEILPTFNINIGTTQKIVIEIAAMAE